MRVEVGTGSATTRAPRGLTCSVNRLIDPPLPLDEVVQVFALALIPVVLGMVVRPPRRVLRRTDGRTGADRGSASTTRRDAMVGGKVDAVLDLIGGEALEDAPAQMGDPKRVASVIDADTVLGLGGSYVFVRPDRENLARLTELVEAGKLRVSVAKTFTLEEFADAHRYAESEHPRGKVVVTI